MYLSTLTGLSSTTPMQSIALVSEAAQGRGPGCAAAANHSRHQNGGSWRSCCVPTINPPDLASLELGISASRRTRSRHNCCRCRRGFPMRALASILNSGATRLHGAHEFHRRRQFEVQLEFQVYLEYRHTWLGRSSIAQSLIFDPILRSNSASIMTKTCALCRCVFHLSHCIY